MDFNEFFRIIDKYFNYKASNYCLHDDTQTVECTLYESFVINFSFGDRYGVFGASIMLDGAKRSLTKVLGKKISLDSDKASIEKNLSIIDEYCRLRLPDKFLVAFDKAYKEE